MMPVLDLQLAGPADRYGLPPYHQFVDMWCCPFLWLLWKNSIFLSLHRELPLSWQEDTVLGHFTWH